MSKYSYKNKNPNLKIKTNFKCAMARIGTDTHYNI